MVAQIDVCQETTITRPSCFACYSPPPPPPNPQTDSPLKALLIGARTEEGIVRGSDWFAKPSSDFFVPTNQMSCYVLFLPIRCVVIFCSNQSDVLLFFVATNQMC